MYISNERLITLVEDMLNLSRIESGRMEYKFEKIQLETVCREIFDTFVIRAKEKKLKFELKMPKKLLKQATTDKSKLQEIISNLIDNALKYTNKGWVRVVVEDAKKNIRISIIDTGIGIPKEEMSFLFQKFSRGKDISRLNTAGTGLGLHVGKRMMEDLGGRIWVESKGAGFGSTFFIEVPYERKEEK